MIAIISFIICSRGFLKIKIIFIILIFITAITSCIPSKIKTQANNAQTTTITALADGKTIDNPSNDNDYKTENTDSSQVKKYEQLWIDAKADISFLAEMHNLEEVDIEGNSLLIDITPLSALTNLKMLTLNYTPNIQSIKPLSNLVNLEYLLLNYEKHSDYAELKNLRKLKELLIGGESVTSLFYITNLTELERLMLYIDNENIDTHGFGRLVNLKYLRLTGNGQRIDLTALSNLKNLEEIYLNRFVDLDLRPLQSLPGLKMVNLYESTVSVSGIMGLPDNKTIETLDLPSNYNDLPEDFYNKLRATDIRWGAEDGR
jgi:Leucine-rich repeat (LRR) protein